MLSVDMLTVVTVVMLSVSMLTVVMLSVSMLTVVMLSVSMLTVVMLTVIMLTVVMLTVVVHIFANFLIYRRKIWQKIYGFSVKLSNLVGLTGIYQVMIKIITMYSFKYLLERTFNNLL